MKAIVFDSYGGPEVLRLTDLQKPSPSSKQVLVRVVASAANIAEVRIRKADPWAVRLFFGLFKPRRKVLGVVFSGVVEAVGAEVTKYKVGDSVFGNAGMTMGTYAEYVCLKENGIFAIKPETLSHTDAASIPFGFTTALHFLRKAKIQSGQSVLVYGASGAVGSAAVQLAKHFGARVTGVCSGSNVELVRSLGADKVIDYTKEDVSKSPEQYDIVFEAVNKLPFAVTKQLVKPGGALIQSAAGLSEAFKGVGLSLFGGKKVHQGVIAETAADIEFAGKLFVAGEYKPVVDKVMGFDQIVEAHRYIETGRKKGNIALVWEKA